MARIVDQKNERFNILCRPVALHQLRSRRCRVRSAADELDDFIDVGNSDAQAHQDVGTVTGFLQQVACASLDHLLAEGDEGAQHVGEVHLLRLAAVQSNDVGTERCLQLTETVELVQDHVRNRIALQLDHDPHARAVALVTDVRDALNTLVAHQFGNLLDHR